MDWQLILLTFINGPGTSFAAITLGFFALIAFAIAMRATTRRKDIQREAEDNARAGKLEQISAQIARVVSDQNAIAKQIETQPSRGRRRREPPTINAQAE